MCPREVEGLELARGGVGEGDERVEGIDGGVCGYDM